MRHVVCGCSPGIITVVRFVLIVSWMFDVRMLSSGSQWNKILIAEFTFTTDVVLTKWEQ
jgi:hypothetical protein